MDEQSGKLLNAGREVVVEVVSYSTLGWRWSSRTKWPAIQRWEGGESSPATNSMCHVYL